MHTSANEYFELVTQRVSMKIRQIEATDLFNLSFSSWSHEIFNLCLTQLLSQSSTVIIWQDIKFLIRYDGTIGACD
jgi:hypothetical protein